MNAHPAGVGVNPSAGRGFDILGSPSEEDTHQALRVEKMKKMLRMGSLTQKMVANMKDKNRSDEDVFKRLQETAAQRYSGGEAPSLPMRTDSSFKYVINPNNDSMRYWDLITSVCLLFTMSVTPFEVAFLEPKIDVLFVVNRTVDLVFLVDIVLNFFLMYVDRNTGKWVSQLKTIQYNYLRGTFFIDVISILPFDIVGIIMDSPAVSQLKVLRVLRLLKLAKLLRILRAGRLVRRLETTFSINYSVMQLYGFLATVLVVAHWLACLLRLAPALEVDEPWLTEDNWIGVMTADGTEFDGSDVGEQYVVALYWAIMTMTTIGYGDVPVVSMMERLFVTLGMVVGTCVFTYLIGAVTGIMEQVNEAQQMFYKQMDMVNTFVSDYNVDRSLRVKIREYFRYKNQQGSVYDYQALLTEMSPELRKEVAVSTQTEWVSKLKFMRGTSEGFMAEIVMKLNHKTYPANEFLLHEGDPPNRLVFLNKGVVVCRGRVHVKGSIVGEDMLYSHMRRTYSARTITFVSVFELDRPDMESVLEKYPLDRVIIKRRAVREAFKVEIVAYAHAVEIVAAAKTHDVLDKMFVLDDGVDYHDLLLDRDGGFVSVMTNETKRDQLFERVHHFLPKQFRTHFVGSRDIWYIAKLMEAEEQLRAGFRIQRAVKRWRHKAVYRRKYMAPGTQVHQFPKWLLNTANIVDFDLKAEGDPAKAAAKQQRKILLAVHHLALHAKTLEVKLLEESSDVKQMLTQLGAKVPERVPHEAASRLTALQNSREDLRRRTEEKETFSRENSTRSERVSNQTAALDKLVADGANEPVDLDQAEQAVQLEEES